MSDDTQKQLISVLSTAIAFVVASRVAESLVDQPETRGVVGSHWERNPSVALKP